MAVLAEAGIELANIAQGRSLSDAATFAGERKKPKITLHNAARDNREDVVEQWVKKLRGGVSTLNKRDNFGYAPIHYAAKFNRYNVLVKLVDAGADPNITTKEENLTPLHFAALYMEQSDEQNSSSHAESNCSQMVHFLVNLKGDKKVEVNVKDQYGLSPLHLACQRGNNVAVDILLMCDNINVRSKDSNKDTPLHEACVHGQHDIVKCLLARMKLEDPDNVDINPQNSEYQTPLHLACREGYFEVVQILLVQASDLKMSAALTQTRDNEANTALHLACKSGAEKIVLILVENGADIFTVKDDQVASIHITARFGFTKVAKTLLSSEEDLTSSMDAHNRTPLHYAAKHNKVDMINFLIESGADIIAVDTESYTPLMIASAEGHVEAFNALLKKGSAIHKGVLHLAAKENHVEVLESALKDERGYALVNSTDSSYNTPLHLAATNGNIEVVEILLRLAKLRIKVDAKNELHTTPILLAASKGHTSVVNALIKHQHDCILNEDEDGNAPIHLASSNGHHKTVKVLLDYHADFTAKNAASWTPINCAAYRGQTKVVEVLMEAGATVNPVDKEETAPLHLAVREGHLSVVEVLLKNNADTSKCENGLNSLDMAIDNNHEDIALCIIQSKQWKKALRHISRPHRGKPITPLRKLIKKMPDVAAEVFNRCSVPNNTRDGTIQPDSKNYNVAFNYEFLEDFRDDEENSCSHFFSSLRKSKGPSADFGITDTISVVSHEHMEEEEENTTILKTPRSSEHGFTTHWGPIGFQKKLHPLTIMVEYNRTDLLKHPLVTSLLKLKWGTFGRYAYFFNLLIYVLFVVFITAFAFASLNPLSPTCEAVLNSNSNTTVTCEDLSTTDRFFIYASASIVIAIAGIRFILELFQLLSSKLKYIFDWVNWMEVILFIFSIAFTFVYFSDCLCPTKWQWQLGCIAVFLTWIDLIVFIQKLPLTGIYVLMFVHIFYTFCKMIILTLLLVFAFSIAFYMAFFDPSDDFQRSSFSTPGRAIVKTLTMTTGEFEYDSIFRQFPGGAEEGSITDEIPFLPVSFLLWIIFIVLMPILLTNLLVGLAVDDIKGIQEAAVLKRLALQVDLALSVEEKFPTQLRRYFIRGKYTVVPNRKRTIKDKLRHVVFGAGHDRYDSPENISQALHPQLTPIHQVQIQAHSIMLEMKRMNEEIIKIGERNSAAEIKDVHSQNESLAMDVRKLTTTINELAKRNVVMEQLILQMAKKQNIPVTEKELRSYI